VRKTGNSTPPAAASGRGPRLLLHLGPGLRQAIDSDEIYFVEAIGDDTRVRTRAARALRDVRPIGVLEPLLLRLGFLRTHRDYLVNPRHVRQVRRRPRGEDWELKLDPPVNRVLPVSRSALTALWAAFGED
jgi:DNA-binding LytR/AlgR family response regulator